MSDSLLEGVRGRFQSRPRRGSDAAHRLGKAVVESMEFRVLLSSYALNTLVSFVPPPNGDSPEGGVTVDASGNLYGTNASGGPKDDGTVFEIAYNTPTTITTLASFTGTNGADPQAALVLDSSGDLFGTTFSGGTSGVGTVFEIAGSTPNAITTLVSFNSSNGANPRAALLLDPSGNLFGTTSSGGAANQGAVFEIAHSSPTTITTLASFGPIGTGSGAVPNGSLVLDSSGDLFGTTSQGGQEGDGTVFEIAHNTQTRITTLVSFNTINGAYPDAGLVMDSIGDLFGTTNIGGIYNYGTVFEIAHNAPTTITLLASFNNGANGAHPYADLVLDSIGDLFGTTNQGGVNNDGTVFEIAGNTPTTITTVGSFNSTDGARPDAGLAMDSSGDLFGTTEQGGTNGNGTVFEIAQNTPTTITTIGSFAGANATRPYAGLLLDSGGDLFGTTGQGGTSGDGTVFEITANAPTTITTLASFNGTDGSVPTTDLLLDSGGDLFGTTFLGGAGGFGTVFEIAHNTPNTITTLASLTPADSSPSGLVLDSTGDLFGTTEGGNYGTVFEIAHNTPTTLTTLAGFDHTNGAYPYGSLALDSSGDLYGTTSGGTSYGTVFEIAATTPTTITTLASFTGGNGADPFSGVMLDASGDLFGTTEYGGASGIGTVFEIADKTLTTISTLVSADSTGGADPHAGVVLDSSGNLFGTAWSGGTNNDGTVFEIPHNAPKTITTLASFSSTNGANPQPSALVLNSSGDLFGTTSSGGASGAGTVFELVPLSNTTTTLKDNGPNPSTTTQAVSFTATISGGVPDGETVALEDASNNNAVVATGALSNGSATLTVPGGTLGIGAHSLIAVYGGDADFAASKSPPYVQTVNPVTASLGTVYSYNATTGALTLTSGTLTFTADNTTAPLINLTASGPASGVFFDTSEHLAGLTLSGGAQATVLSLGSARSHDNHHVLVIGTLGSPNDPTISIDSQSKLDLTDNDMIVHTGTSDTGNSELTAWRALAQTGRGVPAGSVLDGTWTGNGLTSSAAASADSKAGYEQNVLAVVLNSDQILGTDTKWTVGTASEPLGANDIIVKYTYNGDAAMEGFVGDDSVTIVNGLYDGGKTTQADWAFGDFTGSGGVNDDDVTILNGLYGNGTAGSGLPEL